MRRCLVMEERVVHVHTALERANPRRPKAGGWLALSYEQRMGANPCINLESQGEARGLKPWLRTRNKG